MLPTPKTVGQKMTCPQCQKQGKEIEIHAVNKPYQGEDRLSWRNPDNTAHSVRDSLGHWVHASSKEEAEKIAKGNWDKDKVTVKSEPVKEPMPEPKVVWPDLPELTDDQNALYAADDLVEAMAVEKTRKNHPGLEESNPNVFGQIVSAKSQRIALVNLAKVFRDNLL